MGRKREPTLTRRIDVWSYRDHLSKAVTFTVLGPFTSHDQRFKRLSLSELIELRDKADAQIREARGEMDTAS